MNAPYANPVWESALHMITYPMGIWARDLAHCNVVYCIQGLFLYTYPDILRHWNVVISEFWRFWSEFWRFWSEFWRFWSEFWWFWSGFWWFCCEFWRFWPEFLLILTRVLAFHRTFEDICLKLWNFWGNHGINHIDRQPKCRKIWVLPFSDLSFGKKYLSFEKLSEFWNFQWSEFWRRRTKKTPGYGPSIKDVRSKLWLFDPFPPCPSYDVTVTT